MGHTGGLETPQHLHNPWARREEVKNSHVRRFINHSQFKSEGFAQLLSVPQGPLISGVGIGGIVADRFPDQLSSS